MTKNGYLPERGILTGLGSVNIRQPRVRDRREETSFSSQILPRYKRRTPSLEAAIPELYLRGISTNNFPEALAALLGENATGLSSTNVTRMKEVWEKEYQSWKSRRFDGIRYVYIWVDGIYFNIRLGEDRPCMLVEWKNLIEQQRQSGLSAENWCQLKTENANAMLQLRTARGNGYWLGYWEGHRTA